MARVAFFGAGLIGEPMAARLLAAGHAVTVVAHRNRAPIERLVAAGAVESSSPTAAVRESDMVILVLPTAREIEEVVFGPSGFADHLPPGCLVIDMGTGFPPDTTRMAARLKEKGGRFLDAPVTGGREGARRGTLTIMVGGERDALDRARPVFEAMGTHVYHFGPAGAGHTAKLIKSMITIGCYGTVVEAFVLAGAARLDVSMLFDMLSTVGSLNPLLKSIIPKILAGDFDRVDSRVDTVFKDIKQATALGRELAVPLPVANSVAELVQLVRALGFGHLDSAALIRGLETVTGVEIRSGTNLTADREDGEADT
jgi:2-hydroxy-3-oxopropionate reductase